MKEWEAMALLGGCCHCTIFNEMLLLFQFGWFAFLPFLQGQFLNWNPLRYRKANTCRRRSPYLDPILRLLFRARYINCDTIPGGILRSWCRRRRPGGRPSGARRTATSVVIVKHSRLSPIGSFARRHWQIILYETIGGFNSQMECREQNKDNRKKGKEPCLSIWSCCYTQVLNPAK